MEDFVITVVDGTVTAVLLDTYVGTSPAPDVSSLPEAISEAMAKASESMRVGIGGGN